MGPRSKTIAIKRVRRGDLRAASLEFEFEMATIDGERPRTRADCEDGPRPCPWVGCRHHLYLDVNPETGSIKFVFPDLEPDELEQSCALDVADDGDHTLERVGELLNVTRERVRQVESVAEHKLARARPIRDAGEGGIDVDAEHPLA